MQSYNNFSFLTTNYTNFTNKYLGLEAVRSKIREIREIRVSYRRVTLNLVESLLQIIDDVVDVLSTDRETDGGRRDVLLGQFLL